MTFSELVNETFKIATKTFGEEMVYYQGDSSYEFNGIFDASAQLINFQIDPGIGSIAPVVSMRLADIPVIPGPGDTVLIRDVVYDVKTSQENGEGWTTLVLNKK